MVFSCLDSADSRSVPAPSSSAEEFCEALVMNAPSDPILWITPAVLLAMGLFVGINFKENRCFVVTCGTGFIIGMVIAHYVGFA